jgi:hypothetical protein
MRGLQVSLPSVSETGMGYTHQARIGVVMYGAFRWQQPSLG